MTENFSEHLIEYVHVSEKEKKNNQRQTERYINLSSQTAWAAAENFDTFVSIQCGFRQKFDRFEKYIYV